MFRKTNEKLKFIDLSLVVTKKLIQDWHSVRFYQTFMFL